MEDKSYKEIRKAVSVIFFVSVISCLLFNSGCKCLDGYSNESLHRQDITSVYVEMFDNKTFERGIEYELTDALAKRIEVETPYKIITNRNRADTVISGHITSFGTSVLSVEQESGRALEKQVVLKVQVSWKNLKTAALLIDEREVQASASYSEWQNQGTGYATSLAANKLARKITELMEKQW